jgi:general secretion pathway protein A
MYNRYFGFLESPFSVTPDPRFFYSNSVYLEAYANLRYGIETKKGFIAITGEVGTGKTTLLRKLMHSLQSSIHSVVIFNTAVSFNGLLRLILSDLGLPAEGKDRLAMIEELNSYLLEQVTKGDIVCLLIDEAQNLSDESLEGLRLLSNLETDKEKLLQIVLMAGAPNKASPPESAAASAANRDSMRNYSAQGRRGRFLYQLSAAGSRLSE